MFSVPLKYVFLIDTWIMIARKFVDYTENKCCCFLILIFIFILQELYYHQVVLQVQYVRF